MAGGAAEEPAAGGAKSGGTGSIATGSGRTAAISAIESGTDEFVVVTKERTERIVVVTYAGQKYLKTEHEGKGPDSLLALPSS